MKLKRYDSFIKESLEIRQSSCDHNDIKHGDIGYDEIPNLNPSTVGDFIEEIIRCIEVNHEVLVTNLSSRVESSIKSFMGQDYTKWYLTPVDEDKDSPTSSFYYSDLSLALAKLINFGYSIGYLSEKYRIKGWNYSKFFGYDGEKFTNEDDFKKISSNPLDYHGPDISHNSILAGSFDIRTTLSSENIDYSVNEQGDTEISIIFTRAFSYGFDSGAKMADAEEEIHYIKMGTTKERFTHILLKKDKTPKEELELKEYFRKENILKYGEEKILKWEKEARDFKALPKEEQDRIKKESEERVKEMIKKKLEI